MLEGLDGCGDEVLLSEHRVPCEGGFEVVDGARGGVHIVLDRVRQLSLLLLLVLLALTPGARSRTCKR